MLSIKELRMLNDSNIDIDYKIEITNRADTTDMYLSSLAIWR